VLSALAGEAAARQLESARQPDERPLLLGVKILDLGAYYAGPYSSRLLADLGADVIKLEPIYGDQLRGLTRPFRSAQAGKRSLAADMKDPEVRVAATKLIEWADVVHHNMRPGAAERLGIGREQVAALNPQAVYMYAPGWGSSGPDMNRQSFAPMLSGYVGAGYEIAGQFNPPLFSVGNEDPGNGLLGAAGVLMALIHRQRTGKGQYLENPQLNATMTHMEHVVRRESGEFLGAGTLDSLQMGLSPLERLYQTSDGWVCVVALTPDELLALTAATGVPIVDDERFATPELRRENEYELEGLLRDVLEKRTTKDWLIAFGEAGVPAVEPVPYNNTTFMRDADNSRTGRVATVRHPVDGTVRELAQLVRVSAAEVPAHRIAPELGEHTDEILTWLGVKGDELEAMKARRAARSPS
jgi:crotonobetainyl-CoA:carnitine CoA-transferase CaiB-like acyl-CoA transferase